MALERSPTAGSPSRLGNYELLKELSGGGVGSTWLAKPDAADGAAAEPITIFRLYRHLTKKAEVAEGVLREAEAAQKLRAPNVVPVIDARIADGEVFVVSPYAEGEPLSALMTAAGITEAGRGPAAAAAVQGMPLGVVLRIGIDVLRALGAAHEASLLHGELSPQHVRVGVDGITRVSGFGVARVVAPLVPMGGKSHERLSYAAPERVKAMASHAEAPLTPAADLFSVGVMLWELCGKQRLFASKLEAAIIQKVLTTPIAALSSMDGLGVPAAVDEVIQRALDRDPARRYASAAEMLAALEAAAGSELASAADVAAALDKLAGKSIEARKTMITAAMLGKAAPGAAPAQRKRGATLVGVASPLADTGVRGGVGARVAITAPAPKAKPAVEANGAAEEAPPGSGIAEKQADAPKAEAVDDAARADGTSRPRVGTLVGVSKSDAVATATSANTAPAGKPVEAAGASAAASAAAVAARATPAAAAGEAASATPAPAAAEADRKEKDKEAEAPVSAPPTTAKSGEVARPAPAPAPKVAPAKPPPPGPRGPLRAGPGPKPPPPKTGPALTRPDTPMARENAGRSEVPTAAAPMLPSGELVPPSTTKHTPTGPNLKLRGKAGSAVDRLGAGSTLGRYEILMPVAKGGMAAVWAARLQGTRGFQKIVAIKTMLPDVSDDPDFQTMFLDEARVAARIRHPNVVEILDLGEENDVLYLVMEWVEGETLSALQKAAKPLGGIPQRIALRIASQICAGLHNAHELRDDTGTLLDLVHRDVSPANVLVSTAGFVKIVDFGVAKSKGRLHVTRAGGIVKGKTPYLSPEQLGGLPIDRRSDIFSLGALLYVLITGLHPFRGETEMQTVENIALKSPIPPRELNEAVHPEFEKIIVKALEKDRAMRFATCAEMQRALDQVALQLGEPTTDEDVAEFVREAIGGVLAKRAQDLRDAINSVDAAASEGKPAVGAAAAAAAATAAAAAAAPAAADGDAAPGSKKAPAAESASDADGKAGGSKSAPFLSSPEFFDEVSFEEIPERPPPVHPPKLVIADAVKPPAEPPKEEPTPQVEALAAPPPINLAAPPLAADATMPGVQTDHERRRKMQRVALGAGAAVIGIALIALFSGGGDEPKPTEVDKPVETQAAAPQPTPEPAPPPTPPIPETVAAPPPEPPPSAEQPSEPAGKEPAVQEPTPEPTAKAVVPVVKAPTTKTPTTKTPTTKTPTTKTPTTKTPTTKTKKPYNPREI